jgi:uncharacterized membrane protein YeaQ/YmgE (transglycosylase-associated protein family)
MFLLLSQSSQNPSGQDFWRDGMWQSVGVITSIILGLLGLALTGLIFIKQTKKKSISYEVLSDSPIISVLDEFRDNLEIKYKGNLVESLSLIVIRIFNSGNVPIEEQEYARPLLIDFSDQSEIISVNIIEETPENLGVALKHDKTSITVTPLLMNKGDSFTVQILASKYKMLAVSGRISDVQRVTRIDSRSDDRGSRVASLVLAIAASFVSLLAGVLANSLSPGLIGLVIPMIAKLFADFVDQTKQEVKYKKKP